MDQLYLKSVIRYVPETGEFFWVRPKGGCANGRQAGTMREDGRRNIMIDGVGYRAHRLAWIYQYGVLPSGDIDHIDGDPSNNRISNLRDVTRSVNMQNQRRARADNKTGFLGAYKCSRTGRYIAEIAIEGKPKRLGVFDSPELAHKAYVEAKRRIHIGCTI